MKVLVIADDPGFCNLLDTQLKKLGHQIITVHGGVEAVAEATDPDINVALLDMILPDVHWMDVLKSLKQQWPGLSIITTTGMPSTNDVIQAMRWGADEFLTKPVDMERLNAVLHKIERLKQLDRHAHDFPAQYAEADTTKTIVGQSLAILDICKSIGRIAPTRYNVLIQGETGTGKELIARAIHLSSGTQDEPFVTINCSAIVETLLESEFFGYERGAFTGAIARRLGKLEIANRGTFFLDEIGDMLLTMQAKLLRVIEEKKFERLGGNIPITTDVRFISATNKDLSQMVRSGAFRADLLHRLNVMKIYIPPLRERKEDIPLLVHHLLLKIQQNLHKSIQLAEPDVMQAMIQYPWPGNVREMENVLSRAAVLSTDGIIMRENLLFEPSVDQPTVPLTPLIPTLEEVEREHILKVLSMANGNISQACEWLGIARPTLRRKLRAYKLKPLCTEPTPPNK